MAFSRSAQLITSIALLALGLGWYLREQSRGQPTFLSQQTTLLPQTQLELVEPCSRQAPLGISGTWVPTTNDVVEAESLLKTYVATHLNRPLTKYYRQYIGLLINDKKVLYINGFERPDSRPIEESLAEWKSRYISICDGGDAAWGVEFYIREKTFRNFARNASPFAK